MPEDAPLRIPEALAKPHAGHEPGESASDGAHRIGRAWAKTFEQIGGLTGKHRVLDIGCGPGRMAIAIGEQFGWTNAYLGFDVAPKDIDFCSAQITPVHPAFRFVHLDVANHFYNRKGALRPEAVAFPAETGGAEFAFATSVFTHFFTAEFRRYVDEAHRCLAPGAVFLSTYFLLDPEATASMKAGRARRLFTERIDAHALGEHRKVHGLAVAYQEAFVRETLTQAGFRDLVHHRGAWSGLPGRHSQDIVVAKKA